MLSPADMIVIGALALLFFGPDQLPKVARNAGKVIRDVQATSQSFIREMERAADEPEHETPRSPWTSPAAAEYHAEPSPAPAPFEAEQSAAPPAFAAELSAAPEPFAEDRGAAPVPFASESKPAPASRAAEHELPKPSEGSDALSKAKGESETLGSAHPGVADVER